MAWMVLRGARPLATLYVRAMELADNVVLATLVTQKKLIRIFKDYEPSWRRDKATKAVPRRHGWKWQVPGELVPICHKIEAGWRITKPKRHSLRARGSADNRLTSDETKARENTLHVHLVRRSIVGASQAMIPLRCLSDYRSTGRIYATE